jgi:hypothetical protein
MMRISPKARQIEPASRWVFGTLSNIAPSANSKIAIGAIANIERTEAPVGFARLAVLV